jgi:hypothetical protein
MSFFFKADFDDDDEEETDYSWDYDEDSEVKPKISKELLISLTRDWWGRDNPDETPGYGFFPVWAFALICLSSNFFKIV